MNRKLRRLTNLFFRGLIIIAPIGITIYALYFIFITIDNLIPIFKLPRGIGFLIVILLVLFVGYLGTRFFFGRWLVDGLDALIERMPGVRLIYTSVKEVIESFMGDHKKFNQAVWVKVEEHPEIWRIGFLTQNDMNRSFPGEQMVSVYMPHSYAISGWVILIKKENVKPVTKMTSIEAMKFAVSGGVTGVPTQEENVVKED